MTGYKSENIATSSSENPFKKSFGQRYSMVLDYRFGLVQFPPDPAKRYHRQWREHTIVLDPATACVAS